MFIPRVQVKDLHYSEEWFHDHLRGPTSRQEAEALVMTFGPQLGDGSFLIRHSKLFVGDYTITFWYVPPACFCLHVCICIMRNSASFYSYRNMKLVQICALSIDLMCIYGESVLLTSHFDEHGLCENSVSGVMFSSLAKGVINNLSPF